MLNRTGDFAARALLPGLLMALAFLQLPLAELPSATTCHRLSVMRMMRSVGSLTPEVDELIHAITRWGEATSSLLFRHRIHLWALTSSFALAYLLLARERLALRMGVCTVAMLTPIVFVAFGNIC